MARVTHEDCLDNVESMYELVHLAAQRTRQIYSGDDTLVKSKNKQAVTALREIASGLVKPQYKDQEVSEVPEELAIFSH